MSAAFNTCAWLGVYVCITLNVRASQSSYVQVGLPLSPPMPQSKGWAVAVILPAHELVHMSAAEALLRPLSPAASRPQIGSAVVAETCVNMTDDRVQQPRRSRAPTLVEEPAKALARHCRRAAILHVARAGGRTARPPTSRGRTSGSPCATTRTIYYTILYYTILYYTIRPPFALLRLAPARVSACGDAPPVRFSGRASRHVFRYYHYYYYYYYY